jgi:RimJ/RimL family protein N-acetyltransferase
VPDAAGQGDPALSLLGERVALGPVAREDYARHVAWLNDPEIAWNIFGELVQRTLDQETAWLDRMNSAEDSELWLIHRREGDGWRPIGLANLDDIDRHRGTATFRISIGSAADRGQGLGLEVTRLVLHHAFADLGLRNVMLTVYGWNDRAVRTYLNAGFREIGRRRGVQPRDGTWWDVVYMDCVPADLAEA